MTRHPLAQTLSGTVLAGRYRIEGRIGEGAMGRVYRGVHEVLGRPVAIKVLAPELMNVPEVAGRFEIEAAVLARLRNPYTLRVLDYGRRRDGAGFMVLELLEGRTLDDALAGGRLPDVGVAVAIAVQLCAALAEAHALGVVHRDLKPGNVFLTEDADGGVVAKVMDFGVAQIAARSVRLTRQGLAVGSPSYMAPEQFAGGRVDARADLYALGVVLYEMITGRLPHYARSHMTLSQAKVRTPPPALADLRPETPRRLAAIVHRLLDPDPARRPADAAQVADALVAVLGEPAAPARDLSVPVAVPLPGLAAAPGAPAVIEQLRAPFVEREGPGRFVAPARPGRAAG